MTLKQVICLSMAIAWYIASLILEDRVERRFARTNSMIFVAACMIIS